jgi:hypothetical protein
MMGFLKPIVSGILRLSLSAAYFKQKKLADTAFARHYKIVTATRFDARLRNIQPN